MVYHVLAYVNDISVKETCKKRNDGFIFRTWLLLSLQDYLYFPTNPVLEELYFAAASLVCVYGKLITMHLRHKIQLSS